MKKLNRNELLDGLAQYGYELNRPLPQYKGEEVLLNLLNEKDSRLLEGFPVVYNNILDNQKHLSLNLQALSSKDKTKLLYLLLLTYVLLKSFKK